jgi:hypothetical protein
MISDAVSRVRARIVEEFVALDGATTEESLEQTRSKIHVSVFSKTPVGPSRKVQEVYEKILSGYNIPS